jgi:signal transduction histidine kinase
MPKLNFLYKLLVGPKSTNEDSRRREFIFNILVLSSLILFGAALIILLTGLITNDPILIKSSVGNVLFLIFIFIILYLLSRIGFFVPSAYIFTGMLFLFAAYLSYKWGVELPPALLFYVLIIIMSGILVNTHFAFVTAIISSLSIIIIGSLQIYNSVQPDLYWKRESLIFPDVVMFSAIFGIIATVSWLSNREIEKSLKRARKSEAELKEERDMLEIRVEERTQELRKTQMEQMAQVYRFAEFGRLSGGLFHDLVNYLTAVSLNIEKIKSVDQENSEFKKIETNLERAKKATNEMQDFIASVRKQLAHQETRELFSLNQEIKESVQILTYQARQNQVVISFKSDEEVQTLGAPIKFSQIVTNLISNAIDAYPPLEQKAVGNKNIKREVKISLAREGKTISLFVSDNGRGIPESLRDKIFEPFFTTKDPKRNIGIGLSLTKRIVEQDFNGRIRVISRENQGTTFTISFDKL